MADTKTYKILKKDENKEKGEIELEIEMTAEIVDAHKKESVKDLGADLEFPGFRKGAAPEEMVIEKVGEMAIFEKSTYKALNNIIPLVITDEKIDTLEQPSINVTKITPGSPVVFKMKMTLMPELSLPDYKEIAKEVSPIAKQKVEGKEIEEYIDYIRKQRAQALASAQKQNAPASPDKSSPEEASQDSELELPELNDEFVKTLGDFKDVDSFKKQLEENMLLDKNTKESQRRRLEILEKIIDGTKGNIPDVLVNQELERMLAKFRQDIENMKMNFGDYLKELKKTEEDLQKEWKVDAIKRVKMNLILPKIADEEKLKADPEEIKSEVAKIKEQHKEVDGTHAMLYVTNVLTNEEVFKFLENIK